MYRVRSGGIAGFVELVRQLGANPFELIEQAGLGHAQLRNPDTYIPYPRLAELLELAAHRCQSPLFGLLLAERQASDVLGELMTAVAGSGSVGEAIATAAKYLYLHASDVLLEQEVRSDEVRLGIRFGFSGHLGTDQLTLLSAGHLATFIADLLREDRFGLTLHFRQAPPPPLQTEQRTRFRRLKFSQEFDGITLRKQQLDFPIVRDEALLRKHFQQYLHQLQSRYPDSLEDQIREVIRQLLPTGECRIEQVAATLDLHTRTLQSRLRERGSSYREILKGTRLELALHHLSRGPVSITDLALRLGYADVAIFSRHFKGWTGVSPREWRKMHKDSSGL
ncbi:AraC family transcriptional regulator [Marinobacterium nitratireducens]|uniref:AraC family transcriptional regulator n=1 Tax=Marinobacterium nitratireducens TaxID=518897 RepID=A0A917ZR56_9GAMM|nr:AraC family transcriptional regulator [Marinobacterium nitratireducens]GGO88882.1 AraC family transcriptional regulator [Marinobacterium nitratireducens]